MTDDCRFPILLKQDIDDQSTYNNNKNREEASFTYITVITIDASNTISAIARPTEAPASDTLADNRSVGGDVVFIAHLTPATLTFGYIARPSSSDSGSLVQSTMVGSVPLQATLL